MEELLMNRVKKVFVALLTLALLTGTLCPTVWAQEDAITDEYNMLDLFVARPMGAAAGIVGTALFIASLPFTIPTRSVDKAAKMLISEPFRFSFSREFPDRNVRPDGYEY